MRQGCEPFWFKKRNAVLGEQILQHLRILPCHRCTEYGEHSNRHPEVDRQAVDVTSPGPRAGTEDHLVSAEVGYDLVDQRHHRGTPPVHDALAADFHDIGPRQDREIGRVFGGALYRFVTKRFSDEALA
jgi:hypothetical protein